VATYFLVENPFRAWTILTSRTPRYSIGFGTALVVLSLSTTTLLAAHHPLPREDVIDLADADGTELPTINVVLQEVQAATFLSDWPEQPDRIANPTNSKECNVTRADTTSSACVPSGPEVKGTIVVLGDSHGGKWIAAFDEIGRRGGWQVVRLTRPGCQDPDNPGYSNAPGREYTECAESRTFALETIEGLQPGIVVVTSVRKGAQVAKDGKSTTNCIEQAWGDGLGSVLDQMAPHTERVLVLGDMAYPT
jgi:hypothetical protein